MLARIQTTIFVCLMWLLTATSSSGEENWTAFRGNRGDGHAADAKIALHWNESTNICWKTPIHGKGWSSPVVWGNQIWLTTASVDGKRMYAVGVDKQTGDVEHDILVFENEEPRFCHPTNSYASPTPVIEAGRVYVHFGSYGTACLDTSTGSVIWQRRDFQCNHWRGPGASPVIYQDYLFVPFDGYDHQFVVALDKTDGSTAWKQNRNIDYGSDDGDLKKAYCTTSVIEHQGRYELISPSAAETISYNPATGEEYWRVRHGGMNAATRPIYAHGMVYITVGDSVGKAKPSLIAIRPGGAGDVTDSQVAWTQTKGAAKRPSPLVIDDLLFMVSDDGVASCLDARTGEFVWRKRLGGNYRASPLYCDGRIYFFSLEGESPVIKAGRSYERLATNQLDDGFQASPAVSGKDLFVRTTKHLYCIHP